MGYPKIGSVENGNKYEEIYVKKIGEESIFKIRKCKFGYKSIR
jgi:hypothetical protein